MARLASAAVLLIASVGAVEILQKIPEDVEIIHSWGEKRSGSTFQFMAACVAANLKWRGGDGKPRRTVYCDVLHQESNFDVQVTKSHMIPKPEEGEKKKIVIASTVQEESGKLQKVYATGLPISFRVTRQELVAHSLGILMYYAEAFGLSSEDQHVMRDFMKSWEIMRQCCGSQMSKNWRIKLQEGTRTTAPWHTCQMYDLDIVEDMLLDTDFAKAFPDQVFFPDKGYFPWKKGMCSRSVDAIANGLNFNEDWAGEDNVAHKDNVTQ